MVKKTDSHARVLRPGESMALGRRFLDFEIILFRPRHHDRTDVRSDGFVDEDVALASTSHEFSPHDSVYQVGSGVTDTTVKAKVLSPRVGNEGAHPEKKRSGIGHTLMRVPAATSRDAMGGVETEDPLTSPFALKAPVGGNDAAASDIIPDAPLFFDTAVCIFYDELAKMDYVATGRTTADSKGLHYKPHLVILGSESAPGGYCNYNITRPDGETLIGKEDDAFETDAEVLVSRSAASNGPVSMAAADGVEVNLRRLNTCAGFLVSATLFSNVTCLNRERSVYYMVRRPRNPTPLCLVPLYIFGDPCRSCVALMVRKIRVHGNMLWEIVNVSEPLPHQDVKSLVLRMQERGLCDPPNFARDFELKAVTARGNDGANGATDEDALISSLPSSSSECEASGSHHRLSEVLDQDRSVMSPRASFSGERCNALPPSRGGIRTFSALLEDVPRVTREGRRQYNVGRAHVQTTLFDGDPSEEDEVLDDAMRVVVPSYTNASLVRYENGAYNVGSKVDNLIHHYVGHRETYGLSAAGHRFSSGGAPGGSRDKLLPSLNAVRAHSSVDWGAALPVLDRCRADEIQFVSRPELPADLLLTSQDKQLAAGALLQRGSVNTSMRKRQSTAGRIRRNSSIRGFGSHKGSKRLPPPRAGGSRASSAKKRGGKKVKAARSSQYSSGNTGKGQSESSVQRSSSGSSRRLPAQKMKSRVSSARSKSSSSGQKRESQRSRTVAA